VLNPFPQVRFKNSSRAARRRVWLGLGRDWLPTLAGFNAPLANLLNEWRERAIADHRGITHYPVHQTRSH
jgi:hypothetical protein